MTDEFPSITTLIPDLRQGDADAWNALASRFSPQLHGKARNLLKSSRLQRRVDPEDLVNEALARAWQSQLRHQNLRATCTLQVASYLLRTIGNVFIELCRPTDLEETVPSWFAPAGDGETPSQVAITEEHEAKLHALIAELPEKQRQAVVLRHFDGLKYREIASCLGTTPGAAAGAVRNGVKTLVSRFDQIQAS